MGSFTSCVRSKGVKFSASGHSIHDQMSSGSIEEEYKRHQSRKEKREKYKEVFSTKSDIHICIVIWMGM